MPTFQRWCLALLALLLPVVTRAQDEGTPFKGHTGWVASVAFSPDGKTLATASADKSVKVWDVSTGQVKATLTGHTDVEVCGGLQGGDHRLGLGRIHLHPAA
jgi:WD40 repeat protein